MIVGASVVLRPFTGEDVEEMGMVLADPEVLALTDSVHTTAGVVWGPRRSSSCSSTPSP